MSGHPFSERVLDQDDNERYRIPRPQPECMLQFAVVSGTTPGEWWIDKAVAEELGKSRRLADFACTPCLSLDWQLREL